MGLSVSVSISAVAVFLQGLLSFFSPCVLPLLPLYIGYLSGEVTEKDEPAARRRGRIMLNTVFFVLGISAAFFLLGLGMTAIGRFFGAHQRVFAGVGGIIVILFGLYQLGVFGDSAALETERRLPLPLDTMAMSPWTALVMGFAFSFAWTPCVGPALSSVLLMAASSSSQATGFLLIGVYTMGFVIPFLAVGLFTTTLLETFRRHRNVVRYTGKVGGVLLLLMGVLMLTGTMNRLSGYFARLTDAGTAETAVTETAAPDPSPLFTAEPEPTATPMPEEPEQEIFPAFDFALTDQYGQTHSLADYRGKVIFLNFWATWCPPCRAEMPDIEALYEEYANDPDSDVAILGVAFPGLGGEEDVQGVTDFLAENGYTYPVVMDTAGELMQPYYITAFPTTFMIDAEGNIYGYVTGSISKEIMRDIIEQTREASCLS